MPGESRFPAEFRDALIGIGFSAVVGLGCGVCSAILLGSLEFVTHWREDHTYLVYGLPLAGIFLGFLYKKYGTCVLGGNNLVIETIHDGGDVLPIRMGPMVLLGTLVTHLFGGSAGREGTALQMGASFADRLALVAGVSPTVRRYMLFAGVAGGFGSAFGTPFAGAVFAAEFLFVRRIRYSGLLPAFVASVVADQVTRGLGIVHTRFPLVAPRGLDPDTAIRWIGLAAAIALTARIFLWLIQALKGAVGAWTLPLRLGVGGVLIIAMYVAIGTPIYLGLSLPTLVDSFSDTHLSNYTFAVKLVFTAVTLAFGFIGGEATALFVIGATLGSVYARAVGLPIELGAAVGLVGLFGAAANTPIALTIVAIELFGGDIWAHAALVTVVAWALSGRGSIYSAQRDL